MKIRSYVENKYVSVADNLELTKIISPIDHEVVAEFTNLTAQHVQLAYKFAKRIQKKWYHVAPLTKVKIFETFSKLLQENKNEFTKRMMREIAKSKKDCESEVDRTCELINQTISYYLKLLDSVSYADIENPNKRAFFSRVPFGTVLAISPFNYPLNLAVSKILPSLIVGNTVVFKSATQGTWTGSLIVDLLYQAGLMEGALQFITGKGSEIGNDLVANEIISLINFTGSYQVGKRLSELNPMAKKIYELSGKDPAIVLEDADMDLAINAIIKGAFSYSGQRCTAIKRVLVHKSRLEELTVALKNKMKSLTVSRDVEKNPDIVPLIDEKAAVFAHQLFTDAIDKKAKVILQGKWETNLIHPVLLANVTSEMKLYYLEQFAPILPIISFSTNEEAIEISNDSEFGLGGAIFTHNYKNFHNIAKQLDTGRVTWNATPARGPDNFPFTGIKHSGIGIQGINDVMLESTYPKGYVLS